MDANHQPTPHKFTGEEICTRLPGPRFEFIPRQGLASRERSIKEFFSNFLNQKWAHLSAALLLVVTPVQAPVHTHEVFSAIRSPPVKCLKRQHEMDKQHLGCRGTITPAIISQILPPARPKPLHLVAALTVQAKESITFFSWLFSPVKHALVPGEAPVSFSHQKLSTS